MKSEIVSVEWGNDISIVSGDNISCFRMSHEVVMNVEWSLGRITKMIHVLKECGDVLS